MSPPKIDLVVDTARDPVDREPTKDGSERIRLVSVRDVPNRIALGRVEAGVLFSPTVFSDFAFSKISVEEGLPALRNGSGHVLIIFRGRETKTNVIIALSHQVSMAETDYLVTAKTNAEGLSGD